MKNSGFSLVEMSVVLIIIGLIIGGIMAGKGMIRAAEMNQVITDMQRYKTAVELFEEKYEALPGDMPDAESYWAAADTDNGNGNGLIHNDAESIDLWNHLGLAGLIKGDYDHTASALTAGTSAPETGELHTYLVGHYCSIAACSNWAASEIDSALLMIAGVDGVTISGQYADLDDYNGSNTGFTNKDAFSLDQKIDDSEPLTGRLIAPVCSDLAEADKTLALSMNADDLIATNNSTAYRLTDENEDCFFALKF